MTLTRRCCVKASNRKANDMALYELSSKKNLVLLGDKEFKRFFNYNMHPVTFYDWANYEFDLSSLGEMNHHPKHINKVLHTAFGSKIPMRFSAAMFNTFIRDNAPREAWFALTYTGRHWKRFNSDLVNTAVEHNHLVQQAVKDNTLNLLPLMLHLEKDTQQLKAHFGKGLWKRLASTSKSRMKVLAPLVSEEPAWIEVRTGILAEKPIMYNPASMIAAKVAPTVDSYRDTYMLVRDTVDMATRLREKVNPHWSFKRWEEEHQRLTKEFLVKSYSSKPFCEVEVYEEDRYTFTLLNSEMDIALEGKTMGHCVGSYAARAAAGQYEVYRVEGQGERATLGVYANLYPREHRYDQCYGKYNSGVPKSLILAAHKVVGRRNDSIRLRDGQPLGQGHEDTRAVMDNGREGVPLNQLL